MPRRFVSALVVGSVLIAALAVVSPAPVAGHGSARPSRAHVVAMPSWAAALASEMFAPIAPGRRPRHARAQSAPPVPLQGSTCYVVGGSVCPFEALVPRVVPIRMP